MMLLKRFLHWLPFVHFYGKWEDVTNPNYVQGHWHQKRYCQVCNRGQRRWTDSNALK